MELERWLWCTTVAMSTTSPAVRSQVLSILSGLIFPSADNAARSDTSFKIRYPSVLQALIYSLATLRRSLSSSPEEDHIVVGIMSRIFRGDCVSLSPRKLTEEYGVLTSGADEEGGRQSDIRRAILVDGVLRCMQVGDEAARRWALNHIEVQTFSLIYSRHLRPSCLRFFLPLFVSHQGLLARRADHTDRDGATPHGAGNSSSSAEDCQLRQECSLAHSPREGAQRSTSVSERCADGTDYRPDEDSVRARSPHQRSSVFRTILSQTYRRNPRLGRQAGSGYFMSGWGQGRSTSWRSVRILVDRLGSHGMEGSPGKRSRRQCSSFIIASCGCASVYSDDANPLLSGQMRRLGVLDQDDQRFHERYKI